MIEQSSHTSDKNLQSLLEIGKEIPASLEYVNTLNLIVKKAIELAGNKADGRIRLIDKNENLIPVAVQGALPPVIWKVGQCIAGWVAEKGKPVYIKDAHKNKQFKTALETIKDSNYKKYLEEIGSEIAVPIKHGNRVIGVLDVHSPNKDAFRSEYVDFLVTLANYAAIAIGNAQLLKSLEW